MVFKASGEESEAFCVFRQHEIGFSSQNRNQISPFQMEERLLQIVLVIPLPPPPLSPNFFSLDKRLSHLHAVRRTDQKVATYLHVQRSCPPLDFGNPVERAFIFPQSLSVVGGLHDIQVLDWTTNEFRGVARFDVFRKPVHGEIFSASFTANYNC